MNMHLFRKLKAYFQSELSVAARLAKLQLIAGAKKEII